jgi:hypothetical protein
MDFLGFVRHVRPEIENEGLPRARGLPLRADGAGVVAVFVEVVFAERAVPESRT